MEKSLPVASVQYGDMEGTAAADWHGGTEIYDLAKSKGIDTNKYSPVALSFYGVPPTSFTIYAVDNAVTGAISFDEIDGYARQNNGTLPVVLFHFSSNMDELSKYMKRR